MSKDFFEEKTTLQKTNLVVKINQEQGEGSMKMGTYL
jgi:hypothetical protein